MHLQILIDSGFLRVLFDSRHPRYIEAQNASKIHGSRLLVPNVVLTEALYLMQREGGVRASIRLLESLQQANFQLVSITQSDLRRIQEVMTEYIDVRLDFVDCCIVTLAERLNITTIATYDRRDFTIIRPKHCEYFELLP